MKYSLLVIIVLLLNVQESYTFSEISRDAGFASHFPTRNSRVGYWISNQKELFIEDQKTDHSKNQKRIKRKTECVSQNICSQKLLQLNQIPRPPCRCDENCHKFGDCCEEITVEASSLELSSNLQYFSEQNLSLECQSLPSPFSWMDTFMVVDCPKRTNDDLQSMCQKTIPDHKYHYSLDIPVPSKTHENRLYQNIYCARCHNDTVSSLEAYLNCNGTTQEKDYIREHLSWGKQDNSCSLKIKYNLEEMRWCPKKLVSSCKYSLNKELVQACHIYGPSFVSVDSITYKNRFCSMCNGHKDNDHQCLQPMTEPNIDFHDNSEETQAATLFNVDVVCNTSDFVDPVTGKCIEQCYGSNCSAEVMSLFPIVPPKLDPHNCMEHMIRLEKSILHPNGTLFLRDSQLIFHHGEYEIVGSKWLKSCWKDRDRSFVSFVLSRIISTISLVSLALHMIIFLLLPRKRNIPSMNLFSLTISLFIATVIFLFFFRLPRHPNLCFISALVLHYSLSAAFLWMNVLSIDIYRTFRSNTYKVTSSKAFLQYSIYAWITPLITTSIVGLVDKKAPRDFPLIPDFGGATCWFNNKWGLVVFFSAPACIIILVNMSLYALSVYVIIQQHKLGKLASSTVDIRGKTNSSKDEIKQRPTIVTEDPKRQNGSIRTKFQYDKETFFKEKFKEKLQRKMRLHRKLCLRLILYSKLALIMGMTWIFAFLSFHTRSVILEYCFIIFNGFQGTFIFLAFDCKKKIIHNVKQKLGIEVANQASASVIHSSTTEPLPKTNSSNIRLTSFKSSAKNTLGPTKDSLTCV